MPPAPRAEGGHHRDELHARLGLHLYFWAPAGVVVPSSIGWWPGVDVRAPGQRLGGYLVGPGSVVDGVAYTVARDVAIAPLPAWLTRKLTGRGRAGVTAVEEHRNGNWR